MTPTPEDIERHFRLLLRRGCPEEHARRLATGLFIGIGVVTDSTFIAGMDDGFGDDERTRKQAYKKARAAGVNPNGKRYFTGLAKEPFDPKAWISHDGTRAQIQRRCEQEGWGCKGAVEVNLREAEADPLGKPYQTNDRIVNREVERIIHEQHGGKLAKKKRAELVAATRERLSGDQS